MQDSLKKIINLPDETEVYCGHEYTLSNAKFCLSLQPNNIEIKKKYDEIVKKRNNNQFTVPFKLGEQKLLNPFLQFDNKDFIKTMNLNEKTETEIFEYLRNKKDNF